MNILDITKLREVIEFLQELFIQNNCEEMQYWYLFSFATLGMDEIIITPMFIALCSFRTIMLEKFQKFEVRFVVHQGCEHAVMIKS
jgi:hypothetical protein